MAKEHFHHHIFSISQRKNTGYDIPLHTRLGTEFLVLLIALMTFLLLLAALGSASLGNLTDKWVGGLQNTLTIEIPAGENTKQHAESLQKQLQIMDGVKSSRILNQSDMSDILSPWLGNDISILSDLPLPTLISVEISDKSLNIKNKIEMMVRKYAPEAIADSHESWLNDLMKLTTSLQLTAFVIFTLILFVTSIVIAGAVRSRMAMHQRELELLHIMGASDKYISFQFIRYIFSQTIKGISFGILAGLIIFICISLFTGQAAETLPAIKIKNFDLIILLSIPVLLIAIGTLTARQTVYSVLREMP